MSAGPLRIASSDVSSNASININKNTVDNEIATTQRIVVTAVIIVTIVLIIIVIIIIIRKHHERFKTGVLSVRCHEFYTNGARGVCDKGAPG